MYLYSGLNITTSSIFTNLFMGCCVEYIEITSVLSIVALLFNQVQTCHWIYGTSIAHVVWLNTLFIESKCRSIVEPMPPSQRHQQQATKCVNGNGFHTIFKLLVMISKKCRLSHTYSNYIINKNRTLNY